MQTNKCLHDQYQVKTRNMTTNGHSLGFFGLVSVFASMTCEHGFLSPVDVLDSVPYRNMWLGVAPRTKTRKGSLCFKEIELRAQNMIPILGSIIINLGVLGSISIWGLNII